MPKCSTTLSIYLSIQVSGSVLTVAADNGPTAVLYSSAFGITAVGSVPDRVAIPYIVLAIVIVVGVAGGFLAQRGVRRIRERRKRLEIVRTASQIRAVRCIAFVVCVCVCVCVCCFWFGCSTCSTLWVGGVLVAVAVVVVVVVVVALVVL